MPNWPSAPARTRLAAPVLNSVVLIGSSKVMSIERTKNRLAPSARLTDRGVGAKVSGTTWIVMGAVLPMLPPVS